MVRFTAMNKEQYLLTTNSNHMVFEFESIGPRGRIKKGVSYTPRYENGILFYNLGFGDLNEQTGELDDLAKSNNLDREKVLTTVAATVLEFTEHFPNVAVYAEGSDRIRTRLYQMAITANFEDIDQILFVYGRLNKKWYPFERNVNYNAFAVLRKL